MKVLPSSSLRLLRPFLWRLFIHLSTEPYADAITDATRRLYTACNSPESEEMPFFFFICTVSPKSTVKTQRKEKKTGGGMKEEQQLKLLDI